jgi:hypothetical protein
MKSEFRNCLAYWVERVFDEAIALVNKLDVWQQKRAIEKTRAKLEKQFISQKKEL